MIEDANIYQAQQSKIREHFFKWAFFKEKSSFCMVAFECHLELLSSEVPVRLAMQDDILIWLALMLPDAALLILSTKAPPQSHIKLPQYGWTFYIVTQESKN